MLLIVCGQRDWPAAVPEAERLGVPDDQGMVAILPIGWPRGRFGPVSRTPAHELTFHDRWGRTAP